MTSLCALRARLIAAALLMASALAPLHAAAQTLPCPQPDSIANSATVAVGHIAGCAALGNEDVSGAATSMIQLQQTVAARALAIQVTNGMLKGINESQSEVAKNIGR